MPQCVGNGAFCWHVAKKARWGRQCDRCRWAGPVATTNGLCKWCFRGAASMWGCQLHNSVTDADWDDYVAPELWEEEAALTPAARPAQPEALPAPRPPDVVDVDALSARLAQLEHAVASLQAYAHSLDEKTDRILASIAVVANSMAQIAASLQGQQLQ